MHLMESSILARDEHGIASIVLNKVDISRASPSVNFKTTDIIFLIFLDKKMHEKNKVIFWGLMVKEENMGSVVMILL